MVDAGSTVGFESAERGQHERILGHEGTPDPAHNLRGLRVG